MLDAAVAAPPKSFFGGAAFFQIRISYFADMLVPIMFWRDAGVTLEIAAEKERIIVPDLFGNLFDRISAFEQTPACVVDSLPS